jgi:hypothetical protein
VQVFEYRYNVKFAADFASVSYTNHNFQQFSPNYSCGTCTLEDIFIGINRCKDRANGRPCPRMSTYT